MTQWCAVMRLITNSRFCAGKDLMTQNYSQVYGIVNIRLRQEVRESFVGRVIQFFELWHPGCHNSHVSGVAAGADSILARDYLPGDGCAFVAARSTSWGWVTKGPATAGPTIMPGAGFKRFKRVAWRGLLRAVLRNSVDRTTTKKRRLGEFPGRLWGVSSYFVG